MSQIYCFVIGVIIGSLLEYFFIVKKFIKINKRLIDTNDRLIEVNNRLIQINRDLLKELGRGENDVY